MKQVYSHVALLLAPQCASYLIQHGAEAAMLSVRYPPSLLHLAVMANDNDCDINGTRESCVALLLELLPVLCDEIEFEDDSGVYVRSYVLCIAYSF